MIGPVTRSLSLIPSRWAGLLAMIVLPLSAGGCIAQTGTEGGSEEHGSAAKGDDPVGLQDTVEPVEGPIPSPWAPTNPGGQSTTDTEVVAAPVPSPWANSASVPTGAVPGSATPPSGMSNKTK